MFASHAVKKSNVSIIFILLILYAQKFANFWLPNTKPTEQSSVARKIEDFGASKL